MGDGCLNCVEIHALKEKFYESEKAMDEYKKSVKLELQEIKNSLKDLSDKLSASSEQSRKENLEAVEKLQIKIEELSDRIYEEEIKSAKRDEQIKTVFTTLNDIKSSINLIVDKLEKLQLKPSETFDKVKMALLSALIGGAVTLVISLIIASMK